MTDPNVRQSRLDSRNVWKANASSPPKSTRKEKDDMLDMEFAVAEVTKDSFTLVAHLLVGAQDNEQKA